MLGLSRVGAVGRHLSGDLLIAFSNARENRVDRASGDVLRRVTHVADTRMDEFFIATIEATEEAVLNALVAADTMTAGMATWQWRSPVTGCSRSCGDTGGCRYLRKASPILHRAASEGPCFRARGRQTQGPTLTGERSIEQEEQLPHFRCGALVGHRLPSPGQASWAESSSRRKP
jgi:hypothetical protein